MAPAPWNHWPSVQVTQLPCRWNLSENQNDSQIDSRNTNVNSFQFLYTVKIVSFKSTVHVHRPARLADGRRLGLRYLFKMSHVRSVLLSCSLSFLRIINIILEHFRHVSRLSQVLIIFAGLAVLSNFFAVHLNKKICSQFLPSQPLAPSPPTVPAGHPSRE
jgi:hypothetical protein